MNAPDALCFVAKPRKAGGCWASLMRLTTRSNCRLHAREGFHTCRLHTEWEAKASAASLELRRKAGS